MKMKKFVNKIIVFYLFLSIFSTFHIKLDKNEKERNNYLKKSKNQRISLII